MLRYMPLDRDRLARSRGCECNLFFQTDALVAEIHALEPLLIR